ncbi:MAG: SEC-C domain-containing protein [Elusimicrobia bacterium]|nr:SEC-C domain-containing protein [Elusimicrobiota bacterium]
MLKTLWNKITGKETTAAQKAEETVKQDAFKELEKFKGDRKQLFKMMRNPQVRQQVALLYQRMQADGVDVKNQEAVKQWAMSHKDELEKPAPEQPQQKVQQVVNQDQKIGRNDPCSCGSGKKFKKCCALKNKN